MREFNLEATLTEILQHVKAQDTRRVGIHPMANDSYYKKLEHSIDELTQRLNKLANKMETRDIEISDYCSKTTKELEKLRANFNLINKTVGGLEDNLDEEIRNAMCGVVEEKIEEYISNNSSMFEKEASEAVDSYIENDFDFRRHFQEAFEDVIETTVEQCFSREKNKEFTTQAKEALRDVITNHSTVIMEAMKAMVETKWRMWMHELLKADAGMPTEKELTS